MPSIREQLLPLADAVREDGRILRDVCDLLREKKVFSEWPLPLLQTLRVALNPDTRLRQDSPRLGASKGICLVRLLRPTSRPSTWTWVVWQTG
jgi:hypothetical protein